MLEIIFWNIDKIASEPYSKWNLGVSFTKEVFPEYRTKFEEGLVVLSVGLIALGADSVLCFISLLLFFGRKFDMLQNFFEVKWRPRCLKKIKGLPIDHTWVHKIIRGKSVIFPYIYFVNYYTATVNVHTSIRQTN